MTFLTCIYLLCKAEVQKHKIQQHVQVLMLTLSKLWCTFNVTFNGHNRNAKICQYTRVSFTWTNNPSPVGGP